jgi:hypothetical protein
MWPVLVMGVSCRTRVAENLAAHKYFIADAKVESGADDSDVASQ